ncbi:MAG: hypothetical protein JWQ83_469 [Lacunisphaera sp.]|nr:hypothetical protein [Lacunisphaera sp.]
MARTTGHTASVLGVGGPSEIDGPLCVQNPPAEAKRQAQYPRENQNRESVGVSPGRSHLAPCRRAHATGLTHRRRDIAIGSTPTSCAAAAAKPRALSSATRATSNAPVGRIATKAQKGMPATAARSCAPFPRMRPQWRHEWAHAEQANRQRVDRRRPGAGDSPLRANHASTLAHWKISGGCPSESSLRERDVMKQHPGLYRLPQNQMGRTLPQRRIPRSEGKFLTSGPHPKTRSTGPA